MSKKNKELKITKGVAKFVISGLRNQLDQLTADLSVIEDDLDEGHADALDNLNDTLVQVNSSVQFTQFIVDLYEKNEVVTSKPKKRKKKSLPKEWCEECIDYHHGTCETESEEE